MTRNFLKIKKHLNLKLFSKDCHISFLQSEDTLDATTDNVFSVAPGEGQKPIGILSDKHFEEMHNPTKYPTGRYGLVTDRKTRLTVHKYFNQRC